MQTDTAPAPFEGIWDVSEATLPTGEFAYTGRIRIQQNARAFHLTWDITAGHYVGIGLLLDDHLFVSCGEQFAGLGIALYAPGSRSAFPVLWTTAELAGAVGTGLFTTPWSGTFEGEHHLVQYLPNGEHYAEWSLAIEKLGTLYTLLWRKGTTVHFRGLGLATSQGLAAGWYPDSSQLAFLDYHADAKQPQHLHAIWALSSSTTLGTETLTRL